MAYTSARGDLGDRVGEVMQSWLQRRLALAEATTVDPEACAKSAARGDDVPKEIALHVRS